MSQAESAAARKLFFIANATCGENVGGGDIHYFQMAEAALAAGYDVKMFGGTALQDHLGPRGLAHTLLLTDDRKLPVVNTAHFQGQVALFRDYLGRYRRTLRMLDRIGPDDLVYAVTDYWHDALPAIRCAARRKVMILGMDSPTFGQILRKGRPDVTGSRLPSLYYWMSQTLSLKRFQRCALKRLLYVHPAMKPRLVRMGYRAEELVFVSNGIDVTTADAVPAQEKIYDACWIGRVHTQKGIDDLMSALAYLSAKIENFRALIIGRVERQLVPRIEALGLTKHVHFSGFVSEAEKFRLFKASRLFLMPSHYESWGIVIGEALACGIPVVAYDLEAYRPVFGDFLRYVPCFEVAGFQREAEQEVLKLRRGENQLAKSDLQTFKRANSWEAAREIFCRTLKELEMTDRPA